MAVAKKKKNTEDIAFVNYFTNICIRNRGPIETILNQYIKRKLSKAAMPAKAAIMFGIAQMHLKVI